MNQCISCGMPLDEDFQSKHSDEFCIYCQDQTDGRIKTYDEVRQGTIDAAVNLMDKTVEEATEFADTVLPNLPHWKK